MGEVMAVSMKKAMKTASMMKIMKVVSMKKVKISKIAKGKHARAVVFAGRREKTKTGLRKKDLVKNKKGKIVSKASRASGIKSYKNISGWTKATTMAKKALGLKGFVPVGGKRPTGKALYAKAMSIFKPSG